MRFAASCSAVAAEGLERRQPPLGGPVSKCASPIDALELSAGSWKRTRPASMTEADDTMLWIEAHSLLGSMSVEAIRDSRPPFEITEPLLPVEAERLFLSRFKELSALNPHPCRTSR